MPRVAVEKGHGRDHAQRVVNRACPALGGTRPSMIKKALFFLYGGPRRFDFAQGALSPSTVLGALSLSNGPVEGLRRGRSSRYFLTVA